MVPTPIRSRYAGRSKISGILELLGIFISGPPKISLASLFASSMFAGFHNQSLVLTMICRKLAFQDIFS